jgi:hypothetical protein
MLGKKEIVEVILFCHKSYVGTGSNIGGVNNKKVISFKLAWFHCAASNDSHIVVTPLIGRTEE